MWVMYAFASAFFAGITAILSKIGIKNIGSELATAIRTCVVLVFSWLIVFISGAQFQLFDISIKTIIFLVLSGFATGASWLCYFKALQLGSVSKVTPVDKSSTILSMVMAFIFLREEVTWLKILCILLIATGTYIMAINNDNTEETQTGSKWFLWAVLSAVFAALTSILSKVGISGINSNLGTAIRTIVVLVMSWIVVLVKKSQKEIAILNRRDVFFLVVSGIATGLSWLAYYKALHDGPVSIVTAIDKLSILVTILFSYVILKEKISKKTLLGLCLLTGGTLLLIV